jgi:hypothetical protein
LIKIIQLDALVSGAFYQAEVIGPDEIKLRRVAEPSSNKPNRDEVLSALQDFFIGAHAACESLTPATRDPDRVRTYFPEVKLITP